MTFDINSKSRSYVCEYCGGKLDEDRVCDTCNGEEDIYIDELFKWLEKKEV